MVVNRFALVGLVLFAAAGALAILPPDADVREPDLRAHALKVRKEYEERLEKRRELASRRYDQATADINTPPWEIIRKRNGESKKNIQAKVEQRRQAAANRVKKRILVSILLLSLIGFAVAWAKHATREVES